MLTKIKYILLVLAICSTIIENMGGVPLYITITYFVVSLADVKSFSTFRYWKLRKEIVVLWLLLFVYIFMITGLYSKTEANFLNTFVKWFKSLLLFILILKDTFNQPQKIIGILTFYIIATFICAMLMLNGIGVGLDSTEIGERRLTFLGTNANKMAMVYVYSFSIALFLMDWIVNNGKKTSIYTIVLTLGLIMSMCIYMMANMASRGAFVCIFLELAYFFIFYKKSQSIVKNTFVILIGLIIVFYVYHYISNIAIFSDRMSMMEEGDYGQRDILVKAAWNIFIDYPIFGVGLTEVTNNIGTQIGTAKTPHNIYLYMLSAGGIIGSSLFAAIIYKAIRYVYNIGHKKKLLLPVLLLTCILVDFGKNGGALTTSINYVYFALLLNVCSLPNNEIGFVSAKRI